MNVAIYGRKVNKQDIADYENLLKIIKDFGWNAILEKDLKKELEKKSKIGSHCDTFSTHKDFKKGIDFAFSIGGDGTFIKTVSYIRDSGVPILGINTGRLGFLANVSRDQIHSTIEMIDQKNTFFKKDHF
jgi:NAD+ kinase